MENLRFVKAMAKGHYAEQDGNNPEKCAYCILSATNNEEVKSESISVSAESLLLELWYIEDNVPGYLRIRQMQTNVLIEESTPNVFLPYLEDKQVKYMGQVFLYAILFKIQNTGRLIEGCTDDMKTLENELDNCMDNSGTYKILDFRRKYVKYGESIISLQQILAHIDKGYYPMQMQNSYVLQGEVRLAFEYLDRRYGLLKSNLIKDLDTYTSIINNNINRSDRTLSVISLVGVTLNFLFGSLIVVNPLLGVVGGVVIAGLSVGATMFYRINRRNGLKGKILHFLPEKKHDVPDIIVLPDPIEPPKDEKPE